MKTITAMDDGKLKTLTTEEWAGKRELTAKLINQRLRRGFSEDEAVNLKRGTSPANLNRKTVSSTARHDTILNSVRDRLWLRFVRGEFKNEGIA